MSEHLLPADLDGLVRGSLPALERRRILAHLLRRCPNCCAVLARGGGWQAMDVQEMADYGSAIERAISSSLRIASPRYEAMKSLDALLADDRLWRDVAPSELSSLRGLQRVEALIEAARGLRHQDPRTMLRLAKLARSAAQDLSARRFGREAVADLRALAWAELASAHRVCDELDHASRAMNHSIFWCRRGSRSDLLLARVADLLASLLAYQRRFPEGCDLLSLVYRIHARAGRRHLAGRALISQANLIAWDGNPHKALPLIRRGFDLLEPNRDPQLELQTLWNMVTFLVDLGHHRKARRVLWQSRALFAEAVEPHRLRWLEGRIYGGLSDHDHAEAAFRQARQAFSERRQVYPAALVGLDLAALWARQGRIEDVYALAEEMIVAFRAMRVAREAIASLLVLKRACVVGGGILEVIQVTVIFLRDLERQPPRPRRGAASSAPPGSSPVPS